MAIYKLGVIHPRFPFVGVEILTTFCFLWHNFGSRYARKPTKGSNDSDDSLVYKTSLSQKIGILDWRLGPSKVGHKNAKTPPLVTSPRDVPRTEKFFFSVGTRRQAEQVEGLNTSLAAAAGELWPKEYRPLWWPARALSDKAHAELCLLHQSVYQLPCPVTPEYNGTWTYYQWNRCGFQVTQSERTGAWPHSPPQMRSRRKVGSSISVAITNGGKRANPPWQMKCRNRDALS